MGEYLVGIKCKTKQNQTTDKTENAIYSILCVSNILSLKISHEQVAPCVPWVMKSIKENRLKRKQV